MKLRENFAVKAAAFLLAVAAFAGAAMLGWYQISNAALLWGYSDDVTSCYEIRHQLYQDESSVETMLRLMGMERSGETLSNADANRLGALRERFDPENSNLRWRLVDEHEKTLAQNTGDNQRLDGARWFAYYDGYWVSGDYHGGLWLWVDEAAPAEDVYQPLIQRAHAMRYNWEGPVFWTAVLLAVFLILAVFLCAGMGHKAGVPGIHLHGFHRLPGDALFLVLGLGLIFCVWLALDGVYRTGDLWNWWPPALCLACAGALGAAAGALGLTALTTFAARCKARTLFKDTLIWKLCALLWRGIKALVRAVRTALPAVPLAWKTVLACGAYGLFTLWMFSQWHYSSGGFLLLWMVVTAAGALYLVAWAAQWKRIRRGAHEIIGGNPYYQIDTRQMLPDLREHAGELNNLGHAISAAAERQVNSERFKAELITNVSHDLKTPLTSIINYVDLLKKRPIDDPEAREYIEVLDRKSQRLKKLTEDLVEASKASTGNLAVNLAPLDYGQLIDQALAECGERLEAAGLTVVRSVPEEPVWVMADGRHLWRVLDNLLTNCAKYALENTRVYLDLRVGNGWAELWVKNISREALDVPPERLMERFVRGDESRTNQGSGLGLSIAQSLTELQHGHFSIDIDGDLFKAVAALPLAERPL